MRIELSTGAAAELVRPEGEARRGLVIAPDIMGLRPLFDDLCARLAEMNTWAVCAVEPFPGREDLPLEERLQLGHELDDATQLGDLVAAADAIGVETVGLIGFCLGGMYALKASALGRFDRCVAFYGMIRIPEHWRGPGQGEPLDAVARRGATEVLAITGTEDVWAPPADVDALEATGVQVVRYEGAEHGFVHDPARPAHRPDDAADAWRRVVSFLRS